MQIYFKLVFQSSWCHRISLPLRLDGDPVMHMVVPPENRGDTVKIEKRPFAFDFEKDLSAT